MAKLPTTLLPRTLPRSTSSTILSSSTSRPTLIASNARIQPPTQQVRHATEIVRPKKPFTWTQVVQLSDGSTYTTRTTSPLSLYRSSKDTRNHLKWQPTESSLQNVEVDEAGKLASFRGRFGAGYDLPVQASEKTEGEDTGSKKAAAGKKGKKEEEEVVVEEVQEEEDSFSSLLSSYVVDQPHLKGGQVANKNSKTKGKKK